MTDAGQTHEPSASTPTGLPVEASVPALRAALADHGHAVLQAPPGAGKTTVIPLRMLDEPWMGGGRIVVLEPRRLATRAAARRMASLLGEEVGATVGYRTRDERKVSRATRIEVVTEGILTRRLQQDPTLPGTALVIFDELHERNLHTDLALALLLDARAALRPDLRVVAMSATLDAARIAAVIGGDSGPAPVVTAEGRAHPVDVRWAPPPRGRRPAEAVADVVARAIRRDEGDVLVFLPGAAEIRRAATALASTGLAPEVDVRTLFGALSAAEQDAALSPSPPGRRRVVLATDIAETSLTVEGVRIAIDAGLDRSPRYDPGSGLTKLHTGPHSRASADQRAGRAGRLGPGVAYRLWSKIDHAARRAYAVPEIASVDLAGFALELAVWGTAADDLPFLDQPPPGTLAEGRELLSMLGALDADGRPTPLGRAMANLPFHPRLARMVADPRVAGDRWLACVLATLLEERDILRGRPDDVPVDVAERVRLVDDRDAHHPLADRGAVRSVERRARELATRAGVRPGPIDLHACGRVLALAYPDRVAQARSGARFRMRSGAGAWIPATDPLADEAFVTVAGLDADRRDSRIRLAASLDATDVDPSGDATLTATLVWDEGRDDLRIRVERRLGQLELASADHQAEPGADTTAALLDRVRTTRLGVLPWTDTARALQRRVAFARRSLGVPWPDLADASLLDTLDEWLAPYLVGASGRRDLGGLDLVKVLRARLGHPGASEVDRLAPASITLPGGRRVPVDYDGEQPAVAVRVQDLFGSAHHPTVGDGRVPVVLHLLSPAGRPVQVTADLVGFWAGSWSEVRKEMAGRYPKHHWPADPTTAEPGRRRPR